MRRLVRSLGHQAMVTGCWPSGTDGLAGAPSQPVRHQPIPCTCAHCPGSDPRLPCWSSACLPFIISTLPLSRTFHHCITVPPQHYSPAKHPNPITTSPHIPQARHPIFSPLHPEFRLSPPTPNNQAPPLTHSNSDPAPDRATRIHFAARTRLSFLLSTPAEVSLAPVASLQGDVRKQALH